MADILAIISKLPVGPVGIWIAIVMFAIDRGPVWWKAWQDSRKLSFEDRAALRAGHTEQVTSLTRDNLELRREMAKIIKFHDQDRRQKDEQYDELHNELLRLKRNCASCINFDPPGVPNAKRD